MRNKCFLIVVAGLLLSGSPAACGLLLPHVLHDSLDLTPYGLTDYYGSAYWHNHVYITGWYDQYGDQSNVWAVNVADPDDLLYVNKTKWGGQKTWKPEAYDGILYVPAWGTGLHMFDISAGALALYPWGIWDPADGFFWDLDYENGRAYTLQSAGASSSSVHIVDVTPPTGPVQKTQFTTTDGLCFGVSARGSYLYFLENYYSATPDGSRSNLTVYNISDELNPVQIKRISARHGMGDLVRRGDYLYVGWDSWGHLPYDAIGLPTSGAGDQPVWTLAEGSESYASVASEILRVNDDSTAAGSRVKWSRSYPTATSLANGTTTLFRARCVAASGDTTGIANIQVELSSRRERFQILTDRIVALDSGQTYMLNATAYHEYCITTKDTTFKVFLDNNFTPIMTGTLTAITTGKRIVFGGGADAATQDIYFDYVHYSSREDLPPRPGSVGYVEAGLDIYSIADPANPALVGEYRGIGSGGDICLLGNGAFMPASNGGFLTVNISNPTAPAGVSQFSVPGYEGAVCANGRYLYVMSGSALHSIEVLDADPDTYGPPVWTNCSLGEASWDTEYFGDALPSVSNPAWTVVTGDSEAMASIVDGTVRINDNSDSAKLQWVRRWNATNSRGATVLLRARCASYNLNGVPITGINNLVLEDGKYQEQFLFLSDRIRARIANLEYFLDGTQWHTYRITTKGTQFKVYVDEQATPVITGTLSTTASYARVWFGTVWPQVLQDIYFDSIQCCSNGAYAPPPVLSDQTPDISVVGSDYVEQDSISGINPATAKVYWSTDAGFTWNPPGGQAISCSGTAGDYKGTLSATGIPLNQSSQWLNKVQFSIADVRGNVGYSPVYNVRISGTEPPGPVTDFTATPSTTQVDLSWTNPTYPAFVGTMIRYSTTGYPTGPTDGTLLLDRPGTPGANENYVHTPVTGGIVYYYSAFAYDSVPNYSVGVHASAAVPDTGPPGPVTSFTATSGNEQLTLGWTNPSNLDFAGTMIRYRTDTHPTGTTDGTLVANKPNTPGSTDSYIHTGLTNGMTYYYSAWAYDADTNYSTKTDASGTPWTGQCWIEPFPYPDGALGGIGGWMGSCPGIEISNGTVKITGGTPGCEVIRPVVCEGQAGIIWVRMQAKTGGTAPVGTLMWDFWIDDAEGRNFARWYGRADTARPRIGGTSVVLPSVMLTGGWDTLEVKIDTNTHTSEFFFNGGSLGTLDYHVDGFPWPVPPVGQVRIGRVDNDAATGYYLWLDNITIGADFTPPGPVTNLTAMGGDSQVSLSWTNPSDPDFTGTTIVCKTTGYPTGPTDGTVVYTGTAASKVHTGLSNGTRYYYAAYAFDQVPNYSTGTTATARAAASVTILQAKGLADGELRWLSSNIVSATGSGFFYMQDPAAYQGIKVISTTSVAEGQEVAVVGVIGGQGSERHIDCSADSVVVTDAGPIALDPAGMGIRGIGGCALNGYTPGTVGGFGPNTIGLLVRVWGRVTQRDPGLAYFYIDDGSGQKDGTYTGIDQNVGIRILANPNSYPNDGYVVTGALSTFIGGGLRPCIVPQVGGINPVWP